MFVRHVNGRPYLAECVRIGGRVVQRHLGPADPALIAVLDLMAGDRGEERQAKWQRRNEERERDRQLDEYWMEVRNEFETAMREAGYHNPKGRGWKKRRVNKSSGRA